MLGAGGPLTAQTVSPEDEAAAAPPAEVAGEVPAEPQKPADVAEFKLPFPEERGGGTVSGWARDLEFERDDFVVLAGSVRLEYQDIVLQADRVAVDLSTQLATAEGNVILDQGPRRVAGESAEFNLEDKTGVFREATAHVASDYFFSGSEVAKVGDDVYTVVDGIFSSCEGEVPDWSFRLGKARIEVEGYARVRHASFRLKKAPVLYSPYILWPTKRDRSSGLLVPNLGYSDRRGAYLGLAYYQTLGRSYDTTFFVDGYSEGFLGLGNEFRYRPTEGTEGTFRGYIIRDDDLDDWRWKLELNHEQNDLPFGMRGVVTFRDTSDFDFFRDFERDFDRASRRFEESRAFVSGSWGPHLVNFQITDRETFNNGTTSTDRRLPELEYRLRATQLGRTPFSVRLNSSVSYLSVDRSQTYVSDYGRFDIQPELTFSASPVSWLSMSVSGGQRFTWYGDSLDSTRQGFTGESLTRSFPVAGAEIVGPSFSRVFDRRGGRIAKLRHIIEPRVTYTFVGDFDEQAAVPGFDNRIDGFSSGNFARVALVNRIKAKPRDESKGGSWNLLTFELGRRYSFDDDRPFESNPAGMTSQGSPLDALVRFKPSDDTSLRATAIYSPLFSQLLSTSLTSDWRGKRAGVDLRWNRSYVAETGETRTDQLRFGTNFDVIPKRLKFRLSADYDIERDELQESRLFMDYHADCYSLRLELRDYRAGNRDETDYRFAFTLKNVGTFLDLTGRYQ